jgi:hypothetical protein
MRAVRQLLPFWGFPGLYLLLFSPLCKDMQICRLFPVLMEHGGVPHGTEIYNKITRHLAAGNSMYRNAFHTIQKM